MGAWLEKLRLEFVMHEQAKKDWLYLFRVLKEEERRLPKVQPSD